MPEAESAPSLKVLSAADIGRAALDDSAAIVFAKDVLGRYVDISRAGAAIYGRSPAEVVGKDDYALFPVALAEELRRQDQAVMDSGAADVFDRDYIVNDQRRHLRTTKSPLRNGDGAVIGILGIGQDITDLKAVEDALRDAEKRERERRAELAALMDAVPAAIFFAHDAECNVMTGNRAAQEILGLPADANLSMSAVGSPAFTRIYARQQGSVVTPRELPLQRAVASGQAVKDFELELIFQDGHNMFVFGNAVPLFSDEGVARGGLGVFLDISAYKRVQRELQSTNATMKNCLAMLAHELRDPLAAMNSVVELWNRSGERDRFDRTQRIFRRQLDHISRLVGDLGDASYLLHGKLSAKMEWVDLAGVLQEAAELIRPKMERFGHDFRCVVPATDLVLEGDGIRLTQLFGNLLSNAAKFTPAGGRISLEVEDAAARGEIVVRVKDNGVGIDDTMGERVFELYVQGRTAGAQAMVGLGIGLALARHIVELHHGSIEIRSEAAEPGTEVIVRLPVASRRSGAAPQSG